MARILLINYYWPPSGGSAVQRWVDITSHFARLGIVADVVTIDDKIATYPFVDWKIGERIDSSTTIYRTNSAELFYLYNKLIGKKDKGQQNNDPKEKPGFLNKVARLVRGNFFLPDPRRGWNKFAFQKAVELIHAHQYDALFTAGPPQSTHLVGLKLKKHFPQIRWIADLHDYWTDNFNLKSFYRTRVAAAVDRAFEKKVLTQADVIMTHCRSSKQLLSRRVPRTAEKFIVHTMGYHGDLFADRSYKFKKQEAFVIAYTGLLLDSYKPEGFVKALRKLVDAHKEVPIIFRLAGYVYDGFFEQIKRNRLDVHFEYLGYVPQVQSVEVLKSSSVVLLINPKVPGNERIVPGKVYEYLAVEKPILGISTPGSENEVLINEARAGSNFDFDNTEGMFLYLDELVKSWKKNKQVDLPASSYHLRYERKREIEHLAQQLGLTNKPT